MANIDVKYDVWKNKLLDLGKRNRLLNYKDTARSNVKIEYPECGALYNMFVKEENALVFPLEYDEENTEIECPECHNIIELDWNEEECGGCCSGCDGCEEGHDSEHDEDNNDEDM